MSAAAEADETTTAERILLVAGEASGDLHAASLARELRRRAAGLELVGVGGDRMEAEGVRLLYHYGNLAVVGITEVLAHLGDVRRAMRTLVDQAREERLDGVVLIDYPDFNFALARRLRKVAPELPIVYYISPQVWAWRRGRVKVIARLVDRMLVILPFEKELYDHAGVPTDFVGHPLLDALPDPGRREDFADRHRLDPEREWVALVPGSRAAEVQRLLPPMLGAASLLDDGAREFLIPMARALDASAYGGALEDAGPVRGRVHLIERDSWELLRHSRGAAVCSGTATLEATLVETPLVVVYRTSWLTYNLGKLLVRIRDIGLVNVVAGRRGVPELLQDEVTPEAIAAALEPLLESGPERDRVVDFLREVRQRLGRPGASARVAEAVLATVAGGTQRPQGHSGSAP